MKTPPAANAKDSGAETAPLFDRIAARYDLLNHLLSCGCDIVWRARLARAIEAREGFRVLDVATGTCDVLAAVRRRYRGRVWTAGIDPAKRMLALGKRKLARDGMDSARLVCGDARHLPFPSGAFDAVTVAFGVRNVAEPGEALREMWRVLKVGGRVLILEFSLPRNALLRFLYLVYFRRVLPFVGGIISRDFPAYRYLNLSVERFPTPETFLETMREADFDVPTATRLSGGVAVLYAGAKQRLPHDAEENP